ncbi:MAG TPA: N-acetylglucosamine-6-phosphate deacetylase [Streptosporangiaceae bacterium]|jgi:N-acetylglucosamine-6-phosphate deacetylase
MSPAAELITDADVVTDDQVLHDGWVLVEDGLITDLGGAGRPPPRGAARTSVPGAAVLPGYVDIHVHGGGGHSFGGDPAATEAVARFHARAGTTALLAGLATSSPAEQLDQVRRLRPCAEDIAGGSRLLGIHLEGPFISPVRKGAHDPGLIRPPDPAELAALGEASGGRLRLLTAAPELAGFGELAAAAGAAGVLVTAGHTDARGPDFLRAIAAGTRSLTHTFNGMRPVTHRDPGVLEPIVDSDVFCELICDGVHVSPVFVRLLRQLAGRDRLILITDAVAWAGLPEGEYRSGSRHVEIRDRGVRLAGTGTLAGSTLTMGEAVARYARYTGAGLAELARVASTNAARLLGEDHRIGRIRAGHHADLVVVDADREPAGVMRAGQWIRRPGDPAAAPPGPAGADAGVARCACAGTEGDTRC